jgi:hypothetical protein
VTRRAEQPSDEFETLRPRHNPFELWVVCAATLVGVVALLPIHVDQRSAIDDYLPHNVVTLWYLGLFLAGLITLVGALLPAHSLRRMMLALALERVGMSLFAGFFVGYGATIELVVPSTPSGALLLALGGASVARILQIKGEVARIANTLSALRCRLDEFCESPPDVD